MFAPPIIEFMLRASLLLCCLLPSAGCYKHVVRTSGDPSMPRQTYDPNVDDTQPGFFDQLFWGDPPAGQDPVEYYLPGINQVEVRHNIGLDFARIIRAMLRQAPNIILVGEMRDTETAQMGIQASLTGHLVFSTLHTNDAPSAVTRMTDMGVPGYMVASSVIAVLAQRLVRKICTRCKYSTTLSEALLEEAGLPPEILPYAKFAKGKGCPYCQKKGYRGRIGIYELMLINGRIREMMFASKSSADLRTEAIIGGMTTLYCDGLRKVINGISTLDEVYRSAKKTEQEHIAIARVTKEILEGAAPAPTPG
jgi:type IV pilus assembly protein PilB